MSPEQAVAADTVQDAVTASSVLSHIRNNRIEYLGLCILLHLLGVGDFILNKTEGVCF